MGNAAFYGDSRRKALNGHIFGLKLGKMVHHKPEWALISNNL